MNHDVFEQARGVVSPGLIKAIFSSPGANEQNGEWYTLCPYRSDSKIGSFSINLQTGLFHDFVEGKGSGGDFIDLIVLVHGYTKKEAAEYIIEQSGGIVDRGDVAGGSGSSGGCSGGSGKQKTEEKPPPGIQIPIPENKEVTGKLVKATKSSYPAEHWGTPTDIYRYRNVDGEWIFSVVKFIDDTGEKKSKSTIPYYYTDKNYWIAKRPIALAPYPVYGIENFIKGGKHVIVEGEKCKNIDVDGMILYSWMGGTSRVGETDWSIFDGERVIIWPDADSQMNREKTEFLPQEQQPGWKAALQIQEKIPGSIILPVYKEWPIESDPDGYDIADFVHDGGDVYQFIENMTIRSSMMHSSVPEKPEPVHSIDLENISSDSYEIYRLFIQSYYSTDCLEQSSGAYWQYKESDHYWDHVQKKDILCNMQRWVEKTGIQSLLSSKKKMTAFFNEMKSYIETHSNGYVNNNPFADSAVSPYIHVNNGAIKITKDGIDFIDRTPDNENTFKELYPTHCLDYNYKQEYYDKGDTKNAKKIAPCFWHFIKGLVPADELKDKTEDEKDNIYEECMIYVSQIIGYTLSPTKPNEYFFGVQGGQETGKSFFIKLVKSIVGGKFCIERPIADMDNRFAASGFWGKKVFIEPDMKARSPLPDGFIKAYAGEQNITIERKNEQPIEDIKISLAIFLISNYDFVVKGIEGIARRFIYLPYKNKLVHPDRTLLDKVLGLCPKGVEAGDLSGQTFDERPAILGIALRGWNSFRQGNYSFFVPGWAQREKDRWLIDNSSTTAFIHEQLERLDGVDLEKDRSELYDEYDEWCKGEKRRPLGKKNFYDECRRIPDTTENRVNGVWILTIKGIGEEPF